MSFSSRILLLVFLLSAGVLRLGVALHNASADEPEAPQRDGVLILTNQNVLLGKITRTGDYFFVADDYGEIRIAVNQVEMVCASLDEAYQQKRRKITPGDIDGCIQLASWCFRYDLLGYAAEQIMEVRKMDANNPRLPLLERQLELASDPPPPSSPPVAIPDDRPSRKALDEAIRELPRDVVASFTSRIQPLVVNSCGLAGCHGPGAENDFHLERLPLDRNFGNRLTQRNLYSVLQEINRQSPGDSPLLAKSTRSPRQRDAADLHFARSGSDPATRRLGVFHRAPRDANSASHTLSFARPAVAISLAPRRRAECSPRTRRPPIPYP